MVAQPLGGGVRELVSGRFSANTVGFKADGVFYISMIDERLVTTMSDQKLPALGTVADESGFFGPYGGRFVPEPLVPPLEELTAAFRQYRDDDGFKAE